MKIKDYLVCCVVMLVAVTVASAGLVEVSLVNPGFETGDGTGYNPTTSFSVVTTVPHSGIYHASFANESPVNTLKAYVDQFNVGGLAGKTVSAGETIELSYWLYNPSSDPMQPGQRIINNLILFDSVLWQQPTAWGPETLPGMVQDTWVQVVHTYVVPTGIVDALVKFQILYHDFNSPENVAGTQYIDDITVKFFERKLVVSAVGIDAITGAVGSVIVSGYIWNTASLIHGAGFDVVADFDNGSNVDLFVGNGDSAPSDIAGVSALTADLQLGTGVAYADNPLGLFWFDAPVSVDSISGVMVVTEGMDNLTESLAISAIVANPDPNVIANSSAVISPDDTGFWYDGTWPGASRDRYDVTGVSPLALSGPTADSGLRFSAVAVAFPSDVQDFTGVKITSALNASVYDVFLIPSVLPGNCLTSAGDIDKNCVVNLEDLSLLVQNWLARND